MTGLTAAAQEQLAQRLEPLPVRARRLLCVIVRQAYRGVLRSKSAGVATMPEIHEACGLDVEELQGMLALLESANLVTLEGIYPFEEARLTGGPDGGPGVLETVLSLCEAVNTPLEAVIVDLRFKCLSGS